MSNKPVLRLRKTGALLVVALIAVVGTVPLAGARWQLTPLLLIPLLFGFWVLRSGTDVDATSLRVRALFGTTEVPWSRVRALAPDERGRVSALLDNGHMIHLTGVTRQNLPAVLAAGGQQVSQDDETTSPSP
ncbi:PH domain-containing protein [Mangrovihabitans endophyticus]|uniref:Low molecular weight protein antigen 6 PH domain-containing protein n=1 Tax=Mangrovihabitans endophyticus TaxID=1751298 RepID=A0A8J3C288_9ACTN|nr:PH domain-containing protein [Mangrovihabitans endophyticus]GGK98787.1 hypothetical protein GCM10012284_36340 [Mangrovihabitans endophyticus]